MTLAVGWGILWASRALPSATERGYSERPESIALGGVVGLTHQHDSLNGLRHSGDFSFWSGEMRYKYYIVSLHTGKVEGTNDEEVAKQLSHDQDSWVIDAEHGKWLTENEEQVIEELK